MASYDSYSGKQYILGDMLGEGGEGRVYRIVDRSDVVAKIYKDDKFKTADEHLTMDRKLKTMISMNIPVRVEGILRLAWPLDILYKNGSMAGFVMPCITAACKIYDVQRADPSRMNIDLNNHFVKAFPDYTWKYLVQYAYNLAWVVQFVHNMKIVIGDLNPNNIYADTKTGAVILIDCDSFDIRDPRTGEHFPCVVGLPEMLAPELQTGGRLSNCTFTEETDNFSLAIHIFRLLMRNADPFGGVVRDQSSLSRIPANAAIINGECPYVRDLPNKDIPEWAPRMDMLPQDIQDLFKKTFYYDAVSAKKKIGERAAASEWCNALLKLANPEPNQYLQKCGTNDHHVYPKTGGSCPWCRLKKDPQPPTPQPKPKPTPQPNPLPKPNPLQSKPAKYRSPYPYAFVVLILGLASGFVFRGAAAKLISLAFGAGISAGVCNGVISVIGVITGLLLLESCSYDYTSSDHPVYWLLGCGAAALLIPFLIAFIIGFVIFIIAAIIGAVSRIIPVVIGILLLIVVVAVGDFIVDAWC